MSTPESMPPEAQETTQKLKQLLDNHDSTPAEPRDTARILEGGIKSKIRIVRNT